VWKDGDLEVWSKPLSGGRRAVILFNRGDSEKQVTARWADLDYPESLSASVRDLWQRKDVGKSTGKFAAVVAPHAVVMVTLTP
jgi:alpha-galactosidase